ncbi:MAG: YdcH family protein [Geminicoccaceae bacterium]
MDDRPIRTEIDTRLETLRAAHRALDERITQLSLQGPRDEVELQRLKKQKLALKDRIVHLESDRIPDIIA